MFVDAYFDPDSATLLVLSQANHEDWEDTNIEFHFFTIDNDIIIWISTQEVDAYDFGEILCFDYNEVAGKGLIFGVPYEDDSL